MCIDAALTKNENAGGLLESVESTFNAMEETPDPLGNPLHLVKVKYKRERGEARGEENVPCPVFLCFPLVLPSLHSAN